MFHITHNLNHDPAELEWTTDFSESLDFDPDTMILRGVTDDTAIREDPNIVLNFDPALASANCTITNSDLTIDKANDSLFGGCFGTETFTELDRIDVEFTLTSNDGNNRVLFGICTTDLINADDDIETATSYYGQRKSNNTIFSSDGEVPDSVNWSTGSTMRMILKAGKIAFYYYDGVQWLLNAPEFTVDPGTYQLIVQDNNTTTGGFNVTMASNVATFIDTVNTTIFITTDSTPANNNFFTPANTTDIGSVIFTFKYGDGTHHYDLSQEYTLQEPFLTTRTIAFRLYHMKPINDDMLFFSDLNDGSITLAVEFIKYKSTSKPSVPNRKVQLSMFTSKKSSVV